VGDTGSLSYLKTGSCSLSMGVGTFDGTMALFFVVINFVVIYNIKEKYPIVEFYLWKL